MDATNEQNTAIKRLERAIKNIQDKGMVLGVSTHNTLYVYDLEARKEWASDRDNDDEAGSVITELCIG
jgi:phage terminase Nu1 subunit (DNA packaging protein)